MNTKKLKQIHKEVKNHPFRLGDKENWESYHILLKELDNKFDKCLIEKFKDDEVGGWNFFIHELRSAIWYFEFEFKLRETIKPKDDEKLKYGVLIPEYQKKIVIVLENYIQQIHKFIDTEIFEEFNTYSTNEENWGEKAKWRKYKLNKENNKFEMEILK